MSVLHQFWFFPAPDSLTCLIGILTKFELS